MKMCLVEVDADEEGRIHHVRVAANGAALPVEYFRRQAGEDLVLVARLAARAHRVMRRAAGIAEN